MRTDSNFNALHGLHLFFAFKFYWQEYVYKVHVCISKEANPKPKTKQREQNQWLD